MKNFFSIIITYLDVTNDAMVNEPKFSVLCERSYSMLSTKMELMSSCNVFV